MEQITGAAKISIVALVAAISSCATEDTRREPFPKSLSVSSPLVIHMDPLKETERKLPRARLCLVNDRTCTAMFDKPPDFCHVAGSCPDHGYFQPLRIKPAPAR